MTDPQQSHGLGRLLSRHARRSFGPGFADRVMRRLGDTTPSFEGALLLQFRRLALIGAAAIVLVAAINLAAATVRTDQSVLEALLGLEPVTADSIYTDSIQALETGLLGSGEAAS